MGHFDLGLSGVLGTPQRSLTPFTGHKSQDGPYNIFFNSTCHM
jgi:hypothetical protein